MADIFDNVVRDLIPELQVAVNEARTHQFVEVCGSPIEVAFAAALSVKAQLAGLDVRWRRDPSTVPSQGIILEPQAPIGDYRADFLCGLIGGALIPLSKCIVVECDGHDWHERTKDQAARDKARDRFLQTQVAKVLHFTGSEVFRSPGKCADEAFRMMLDVYNE